MKTVSERDKAVSEVIGTVLLFGILISLFSSITLWYVPSTVTALDNNYQSQTASSMASIAASLDTPGLVQGTTITENVPLGISGGFLIPSQNTQMSFDPNSFNGKVSYGIGVSYRYTGPQPSSSILNKLLETFPSANFSDPQAMLFDQYNAMIYVAGYESNNIAVINSLTNQVVKLVYAGSNPAALALDPQNHMLYVVDYNLFYSGSGLPYSTISVIDTLNNSFVSSINLYSSNGHVYFASSILYDSSTGNLYVFSNQSFFNYYVNYYAMIQPGNGNLYNLYFYDASFTSFNQAIDLNENDANYIIAAVNLSYISYRSYPEFWVINPSNPNSFEIFYVDNNNLQNDYLYGVTSSENNLYFTYGNYGQAGGGVISLVFPTTINYYSFNAINGNNIFTNNNTSLFTYSIIYLPNNELVVTLLNVGGASFPSEVEVLSLSGTFISETTVSGNAYAIQLDYYNINEIYVTDSISNYESVLNLSPSIIVTSYIYDTMFQSPNTIIYDSLNGYLYVSNFESGSISIVSPVNDSVIARVNLGQGYNPTEIAVSSVNDHIYVIFSGTDKVGILNNFSLSRILNLSSGTSYYIPNTIAYDPITGDMVISAYSNSGYGGFLWIPTSTAIAKENFELYISNSSWKPYAVSYDSYASTMFGTYESGGSAYIVNLSDDKSTLLTGIGNQVISDSTFSSLDGYLYVTDISAHSVMVYTSTFSFTTTAYVGSLPEYETYDPGNNLIYVSNSGSSNITVINAETNKLLNTIWVGAGPSDSAYDSFNGYIYIPDNLSSKISVIDGGFTFFYGRPGIFLNEQVSFGGTLESQGNTKYITPVNYIFAGGTLMKSSGNSNNVTILTSTPITIENLSGNIFMTGIFLNMTGSPTSISSSAPTAASLNIANLITTDSYVGQEFFVSDLYNNKYQAVVTSVELEYFSLTFNSSYSSQIDNSLFSLYNGSLNHAPKLWYFSHLPIKVNDNSGDLTISLMHPLLVYSLSFTYYKVNVLLGGS